MNNEIQHGVAVYPHVAGWDAQPLDVSRFDVPTWAKWIAANDSGAVWVYSEKPYTNDANQWWVPYSANGVLYLCTIDMTGIDWRKTLTQVNQDAPTVPAAQVSIYADAIPADVAAQLWSTHSAEWCVRLIDELLDLMEASKDAERHERIAAAILAKAGALE